jgi:hypothetical protein
MTAPASTEILMMTPWQMAMEMVVASGTVSAKVTAKTIEMMFPALAQTPVQAFAIATAAVTATATAMMAVSMAYPALALASALTPAPVRP